VKNSSAIRRVLLYTMLLNFAAMAAKLVAGILIGSLSIIASGFDFLFDGVGNAVGLVGIYITARPAKEESGHKGGDKSCMAKRPRSISRMVVNVGLLILVGQVGVSVRVGAWPPRPNELSQRVCARARA